LTKWGEYCVLSIRLRAGQSQAATTENEMSEKNSQKVVDGKKNAARVTLPQEIAVLVKTQEVLQKVPKGAIAYGLKSAGKSSSLSVSLQNKFNDILVLEFRPDARLTTKASTKEKLKTVYNNKKQRLNCALYVKYLK
jgi:cytoskeletal protein RodZ